MVRVGGFCGYCKLRGTDWGCDAVMFSFLIQYTYSTVQKGSKTCWSIPSTSLTYLLKRSQSNRFSYLRYESRSHITVNLNSFSPSPGYIDSVIHGFPDWRRSRKNPRPVNKASEVADEQIENWKEGESPKVAYISHTWLGRGAFWSAARKA